MVEILGKRYSEPVASQVLREYVEIAKFCFADDHEVEVDLLRKYGPNDEPRPRPPLTPPKPDPFWINRRRIHF